MDEPSGWLDRMKAFWDWLDSTSSENALFLLACVAILPGLGLPSSPFLILCGALTEKTGLPLACLLTAMALWFNALWTFLFAAYPGKKFIRGILGRFKKKLPELPQAQGLRLAVILRVTPGVPLPLQNYLLGVSGISLRNYLLVSMPLMALWAIGFVVLGDGLLRGNARVAVVGIGLLIALALGARMLAKQYGSSQ